MIAKLASRAAKPRASRAGLEPGPGRVPRRAGRRARRSCTATTSRRCGASARRRPSACTTSACARWATWRPCPLDTRGAPPGQGERRPPGGAGPRRGSRSGQPEPAQQVDRARGDVQPGPRRPARARAPRAAHGRVGGHHAAGRVELGPHDHRQGQVQGPLAAVALAHPGAPDRHGWRHRAGGGRAAGRRRSRARASGSSG